MNLIVQNLHVAGQDSGKGPAVLFLHGWGTDHKSLLSLTPVFGSYRVIAPDLPGFGGTEAPPVAWSVSDYAVFVRELLDKLNIEKINVVIGHSFGGRIAIQLLGNGLIAADKVVLLASHGLPESKNTRSNTLNLLARVAKVLPASWRERAGSRFRSDDYRATNGVMRQVFQKVITQDGSKSASQITIPTLLIYGQQDTTTPPAMGLQFKQLIKGSQIEVIAQAGHYVYLDQPEQVNRLIKEFIS